MSKAANGLKWPKSCFKCFKLVTKRSLPMSSQVMKIWSIILCPSERLAIKSGPLNIADAKRSLSARKVWYAIFFSGEGVAIKMPVENGNKHHRKVLQRHCTEEAEKNIIRNDALSLVSNLSVFYMAMFLLIPPK